MTNPSPSRFEQSDPGFGRYRILKKLAAGGMGEIYLARLEGEGGFSKTVVIKKLLPSLSNNPAFVEMFHNEARLAAQLSHTNIVQIFDFGRMEDSQFIAMEWVHGENLADVLDRAKDRDGALPIRVACDVVLGMLRGLDYAHRKAGPDGRALGLIHRDLAPKNILVSYEGEVKIIDFGLAKAAATSDKTHSGVLKGSYCYMAPEQVSGRQMDARSDLFSVGLVLFELITGRRLFPADLGLRPLLDAIHHGDLSHWTNRGEDPWTLIPAPLRPVLQKALAPEKRDRHASAREFIEEIEEALRAANGAAPEVSLADYMRGLFADRIAAQIPVALPGESPDRTQVSPDAQHALEEVAAQRRETPATDGALTGRRANILFNVLATLIIVTILVGGGFLAWQFGLKPRVEVSMVGAVRIVTDPPGASIFVDGQPLGQNSPHKIEPVKVGREYLIRVEKPGFQPAERTIRLAEASGNPALEQFNLVRATGSIFLVTEPPGASVILDGDPIASVTPVLLENIEIGTEHDLELTLDGHRREPIRFTLESPDRVERFTVEMRPMVASLGVTSNPSGAAVYVNDQPVGATPWSTDEVDIGEMLRVRIKRAGYAGVWVTRKIEEGPNRISVDLSPLVLETRLRAKGTVQVLLNDQPVPKNPIRLGVGNHLLRVRVKDANEELRLRLAVREHPSRENGITLEANVDARPWAKVRKDEGNDLTTPVSGLKWYHGPGRLLVGLPGGSVIELAFEVP